MGEKRLILIFGFLGIFAAFLSQILLKNFQSLLFPLFPPIILFLFSFPFLIKEKKIIFDLTATFFLLWFVFWLLLYGLEA